MQEDDSSDEDEEDSSEESSEDGEPTPVQAPPAAAAGKRKAAVMNGKAAAIVRAPAYPLLQCGNAATSQYLCSAQISFWMMSAALSGLLLKEAHPRL